MTRVYLVRHAESAWTPDEMRPLSARGIQQAEAVADALAAVAPHAIYSSPYTRARQTVEPLARRLGLEIAIDDDLRERRLDAAGADQFTRASRAAWDDFARALPGSEANAAAQNRGRAALQRIIDRHQGGTVVVATHGTLLALVLNSFDMRFDYGFWEGLTLPDVYRLELARGAVTFERLQIS